MDLTTRPAPPRIRCHTMVDMRQSVENSEYTQFARRIIRAHGRRVADGDPVDLAELVGLRRDMDQVIRLAVRGMRETHGYSWADIGRELGISRQAAQKTYGKVDLHPTDEGFEA